MSDIRIPRFLRTSLLEDPDEEAKLAAFRAQAYGKHGSAAEASPMNYSAPSDERAMPADSLTDRYLKYADRHPPMAPQQKQAYDRTAKAFAAIGRDVARGLTEAPLQAVGGVSDAVHNALRVLDPLVEWLENNVARLPRYNVAVIGQAESLTGALIRDTTRFVTGFLPALKGVRALGLTHRVAAPTVAAGVGDSFTRDPFEENLFNLVAEHPALAGPIGDFFNNFAVRPDDPQAVVRLKQGLEGLALAGPLAWAFAHQVHAVATARRLGLTLPELGLALRESAIHTSTHKAGEKMLQTPANSAGETAQ